MKYITVPGKDVTKMPVIGKIVLKEEFNVRGKEVVEEVVSITEDGKVYVLNQWYKHGIPHIRIESMVKEFIPKIQE